MKNYLIFSILSLIFAFSLNAEVWQKLEINAHPINVAVVIVEKGDSAKVADLFNYYGYTLQATEDGYRVMKDTKGNEIRYTYETTDGKFPKVLVKSNDKNKDIEKRLDNLKFKKVGDVYQRTINYDRHNFTQCNFGPNNTLVLQRGLTSQFLSLEL